GFDQQRPAIGIDQGVALAPLDLLARIIAAWAATFRRLDTLAVDDCGAGTGLASRPFAVGHHQGMVHPLEHSLVSQAREPAIHCLRWSRKTGQGAKLIPT